MPSPVPKHLRHGIEYYNIPVVFRDHIVDISPPKASVAFSKSKHRAKYYPGLASVLVEIARTRSIGDPMAGSGRLAEETQRECFLNDIDPRYFPVLSRLTERFGGRATCLSTDRLPSSWSREAMIFSPPYYPRTDRRLPNRHDDAKRGAVVGFRDTYGSDGLRGFIGEPSGVNGILAYRNSMRSVYSRLFELSDAMIVVTKNWTRLGVELRLDIDTILTAQEVGWRITERHGWRPKPSLWARYNSSRTFTVDVEDVLVFGKG